MRTLYFDLETELIDRGRAAPAPVAASWTWGEGTPELALWADFKPIFEGALADPNVHFVNQNIAYDMACAATGGVSIPSIFTAYRAGRVQCVMLNEKLLRFAVRGESDAFFNLAELCAFYDLPTVDKQDSWRLEYASLRRVPVANWPQGAKDYILGDADRPPRIHAAQLRLDDAFAKARGSRVLHLGPEEAYKAFALHLIACKGLYTDRASTLELKDVLEKAIAVAFEVVKEPPEAGFAPLVRADGTRDLKSAQRYVVHACERAGLPVALTKKSKTFPEGQVALGKDVLEGIPDDYLTSYSLYSQASTYIGRVDDMCQGFELPLQVSFDTMLETRRTSTSKPMKPLVGVQAQNFPRRLLIGRAAKSEKFPRGKPVYAPVGARECLRPPPGFVFIQADLPTAELRSVSQQCIEWFGKGSSKLADAINAGKDVHCMLGGVIRSIAYEVMMTYENDPALKEARDQAKPGNFGFWGGMGVASFIAYAWRNYRLHLTPAQAREIHEGWKAAWPEHAPYFARARAAMQSGREHRWRDKVTGEWQSMPVAAVRHAATGYWRAKCGYCQWCNTHFQERTGTAAGRAVCETQRQCFAVPSSALYGCHVVAFTHDELVGVAPEDQAHEAAHALAGVMRDTFNKIHPDVPIISLDPVVSRIYSKDMKAVRNAAGRLVPWEPKKAA